MDRRRSLITGVLILVLLAAVWLAPALAAAGLLPGPRLVRVQRSGGGASVTPLTLISSQISGNTRQLDIGLSSPTPPTPTPTPPAPPTATPTPTSGLQLLQQNTSGAAKMAVKKGMRGSSFLSFPVAFSSPLGPFTAGATYYLNLVTTTGNGKAYFTRFSSSNTYAGGAYYKEQSDTKKDAWFQIWGGMAP